MTEQVTAASLTAAKEALLPTELARQRFRHGLTVRDVCHAVGIASTSNLARWEAGETTPKAATARLLARFYSVPVTDLFPYHRDCIAA